MKVLLVSPPSEIPSDKPNIISAPPLGLAYIAAVLEKNRIPVEILDCEILNMSWKKFTYKISTEQPNIVGITATTPMIHRSLKAAEIVKKVSPTSKVVLGGPHPSALPRETVCQKNVDVVVVGEGEYTMLELVQILNEGRELKRVRGLVFKQNEKIFYTPSRPFIENLDKLPFPARHLLPISMYRGFEPEKYEHLPATTMITSRGCPFGCFYCSKAVFGRTFRHRSARNTVDEIEHIVNEYKIRDIIFYDDVFTLDQERAEEICDELLRRRLDVSWSCENRVDTVKPALLIKMKKAGCFRVCYGVESGNQKMLNIMRKGITLEQVRKAVKWTKDAGLAITLYFMVGTPGETTESIRDTINFAKELNPDVAHFSITVPFPDTDLFKAAKEGEYLRTVDWEKYADKQNPNKLIGPKAELLMTLKDISEEELREAVSRAYKEFYFRPSYILKQLMRTRSICDLRRYYRGLTILFNRYFSP